MRFIFFLISLIPITLIIYSFNNHKEYFFESKDFIKWLLFYFVPFLTGFFFFLFGSIRKEFPRIYSLILIFCIIIPCYVFEFYLVKQFYSASERLSKDYIIEAAKKNNIRHDLRLRHEVVKDLNERGIESYPFFKVNTDNEIFPVSSVPNSTIVLCNELGLHTIYKSDRHGFNNPDNVWDQKDIDLVFLGDSFTQGSCMLNNNNFVNQVRDPDLNVLNLGNGSNNPFTILISLIEYAIPVKPKKIIWMHCSANDIGGMMDDWGTKLYDKYVYEEFSQNLFNRRDEVAEMMINKYKNRFINYNKIHWPCFFKLSQLRNKLNLSVNSEKNFEDLKKDLDFKELFEIIMKKSQSLADTSNSEIHFIHIPTYSELVNGVTEESKNVKKIVENSGIAYYDLTNFFLEESDKNSIFSWETTGHFSPKGNLLTAKFIKRYILSK